MSRASTILVFSVFVSFIAALEPAASQDADANAYIANAPIAGVPKTPYGQWTEEQKKTSFGRVVNFCQFLCVDPRTGSYADKHSAERATAEAKTCLGACIVGHLPQDFPKLQALKTQLRSDYDKAKQLGSPIAWPLQGK